MTTRLPDALGGGGIARTGFLSHKRRQQTLQKVVARVARASGDGEVGFSRSVEHFLLVRVSAKVPFSLLFLFLPLLLSFSLYGFYVR